MFQFLGDGAARSFAPDCPYKTPTICVVVLGTIFASVVECRSFGTPTPDNTDIYSGGTKIPPFRRIVRQWKVNFSCYSPKSEAHVHSFTMPHLCQCFNSFSGFYTSLAYSFTHIYYSETKTVILLTRPIFDRKKTFVRVKLQWFVEICKCLPLNTEVRSCVRNFYVNYNVGLYNVGVYYRLDGFMTPAEF